MKHPITTLHKVHAVAQEIFAERMRAHDLHVASGNSMEEKGYENPSWLPVIMEEVGEVARAINDDQTVSHLRTELIQVMAMCSAWVDAIDNGSAFQRHQETMQLQLSQGVDVFT